MKKRVFYLGIAVALFFSLTSLRFPLHGGSYSSDPGILNPPFAGSSPTIDGNLDDKIWQNLPLQEEFITYDPAYGEVLPQKTEVWMAYDNKNLYFAFKCYDSEPGKIKTSITRRDNIFSDDWVGLSLDAMGNKQTAYDLFCNPNGIQADVLRSALGSNDVSPDFVWVSAGQLTEEGYQVEMSIPLRTIRFKSGKEVQMGILFWRRVSRLGMSGSWPDLEPGQGIFNMHQTIVYENLKSPLNLEILPSFTWGSGSNRLSPQEWSESDTFREIGVGFKYGISSSITADITLNPDFSQVESDVFQVEVNRRYPIFYSEKRPFFMEGTDIFNFFTLPYGYIQTAVHTRQIVDPLWGAKLTGTVGRTALGLLAAGDEWPGLEWDSETNPYEGKKAYFTIARGKQSLGRDNYMGAIYSGREFATGFNRVGGLDLSLRFLMNHQIQASYMQSFSKRPGEESTRHSPTYHLVYSYITKPLGIMAGFEHIGKDFQMDSGFVRRTGIAEGWLWIGPSFYPNPEKMAWLKRIDPHLTFQYLHDYFTGMDDSYFRAAVDFSFTKQGSLSARFVSQKESWKGETFPLSSINIEGKIQWTKWFQMGGGFTVGEQIYYPVQSPFKGDYFGAGFGFTLQPNSKLSLTLSLHHSHLKRETEEIYNVNIIYSRTTYQLNKYFFARAIVQYDSYEKNLLTDILASFTFIPGTVIHLGYGGFYEKQDWQSEHWVPGHGNLRNMKRSFFFKASYLWRF
ncbi:MAG: carbohydrate binding family 9 domain-containing protein [Candidatus Aminicenantes bacterium]|nr:MAG: carbohydrate binding family 9 domain-containing protein [Candidatus Aminicenantes bacterium]